MVTISLNNLTPHYPPISWTPTAQELTSWSELDPLVNDLQGAESELNFRTTLVKIKSNEWDRCFLTFSNWFVNISLKHEIIWYHDLSMLCQNYWLNDWKKYCFLKHCRYVLNIFFIKLILTSQFRLICRQALLNHAILDIW